MNKEQATQSNIGRSFLAWLIETDRKLEKSVVAWTIVIVIFIGQLIHIGYKYSNSDKKSFYAFLLQPETSPSVSKLNKIQALQRALAENRSIYQVKVSKLDKQINLARNKINEQVENSSLDNYLKAAKDQIVNNNLQVIAKADAYKNFFYDAINKIVAAEVEMARLEGLAQVDLIAVEGLENDKKTQELLKQIDSVISKIQPQANALVTPKDLTNERSLEEIWNLYISKSSTSL